MADCAVVPIRTGKLEYVHAVFSSLIHEQETPARRRGQCTYFTVDLPAIHYIAKTEPSDKKGPMQAAVDGRNGRSVGPH